MAPHSWLLHVAFVSIFHLGQINARTSHGNELVKELLANRSEIGTIERPVFNFSDTVYVRFGLGLIQILNVDEKAQVIKLKVWERHLWEDELMTWNPQDHYGITTFRLPASSIWLPDIVLTNSIKNLKKFSGSRVLLNSSGEVLWLAEVVVEATCAIDITYFPHDVHNCTLKYLSWLHDGWLLDFHFFENQTEIDTTELIDSNEWIVLKSSAWKHVRFYPCCSEPFPALFFSLVIRRNPAFYNFVMVYPSVLLSALTPVLFLTPPSVQDRNGFAIGIFGAFFLLLLIVADVIPQALTSIPVYGVYLLVNMTLVVLAMFVNALVSSLHDCPEHKEMPQCLKWVISGKTEKICCLPHMNQLSTQPENNGMIINKEKEMEMINKWKILSAFLDRTLFVVYIVVDLLLFLAFIVRLW